MSTCTATCDINTHRGEDNHPKKCGAPAVSAWFLLVPGPTTKEDWDEWPAADRGRVVNFRCEEHRFILERCGAYEVPFEEALEVCREMKVTGV